MGESLLTTLSMENLHPSTLLSMDPSGGAPPPAVASSASASAHDDCDRELMIQQRQQMVLPGPPDINLPLSAERSPPPQLWSSDPCDILDVGLAPQIYETEAVLNLPKAGCSATAVAAAAGARKCAKRGDSIWGAWFFFNFYFRLVLSEKSKGYGFLMQWMLAIQIPPCRSKKPTTAQIQNFHHCPSRLHHHNHLLVILLLIFIVLPPRHRPQAPSPPKPLSRSRPSTASALALRPLAGPSSALPRSSSSATGPPSPPICLAPPSQRRLPLLPSNRPKQTPPILPLSPLPSDLDRPSLAQADARAATCHHPLHTF